MKKIALLVLLFLLTGCVYTHQEVEGNKTFPSMNEDVLKDDGPTSSDSNPVDDTSNHDVPPDESGSEENPPEDKVDEQEPPKDDTDDIEVEQEMILKIDGSPFSVIWAINDSVKELKKLASDGLTIQMTRYGEFEQYGDIGHTLPSNDEYMTVNYGDIVLYQSNKLVIFYDTNSYTYTRLGHITISKSEITDLLSEEDVVVTLELK